MKRIFLMITAVVLLLSLVGCEIRLPGIDISINNSNNSPKPVGTVAPNATDAMPTVAPTIAPTMPMMPTEPAFEPTEPAEEPTQSEDTPNKPATPAECSHSYTGANCETPATCTLCGNTNGEALGHSFEGGSCDTPGTCSRCGKQSESGGEHTYYGGICTVCGNRNERFDEIKNALKRSERYPKYIEINYGLIDSEYELFKLTSDPDCFADAHKYALEIHDWLNMVIKYCEDYRELNMLTDDCRELLLEYPTVPSSASTSAMRSYISDARAYARKASRISIPYNVLCEDYDLPGV